MLPAAKNCQIAGIATLRKIIKDHENALIFGTTQLIKKTIFSIKKKNQSKPKLQKSTV